jgi:hypothetical protein
MGGTDGFDQCIAYYRPKVKSKKSWMPRTFIHIIIMSCVNAYILWYLYKNLDSKKYPYLHFLRKLIEELAYGEMHRYDNFDNGTPINKKARTFQSWERDESRLRGVHFAESIEEIRFETLDKEYNTIFKRSYKRGHCRLCRLKTSNYCELCKIRLCKDKNFKFGITCFKAFHTCPVF